MDEAATAYAARLREALSDSHQRIERLPLAVRLAHGRIDRAAYIPLLRELLAMHQALEAEFDRPTAPQGLLDDACRRTETLRRDLAALGADPTAAHRLLPETRELQQDFRLWGASDPWRLAGALYVFEGSRMGSMFLGPAVARAFGTPATLGHGIDYHLEGVAERPRLWKELKLRLAGAVVAAGAEASGLAGAAATMEGLLRTYAALEPEATPADAETASDEAGPSGGLPVVAGSGVHGSAVHDSAVHGGAAATAPATAPGS